MKSQRKTQMLYFALIIALVSGVPHSWGYTNPIEGGSTETVTDVWNVDSDLDVGYMTPNNTLIISGGGLVTNTGKIYLGHYAASHNNSVTVIENESLLESWSGIQVGYGGSGNSATVSAGGRISCVNDVNLGRYAQSSNNTVTVTGSGSVWESFEGFHVGYEGSSNSLTVADGGQIYSYGGNSILGRWGMSSNNSALVTGAGSAWDSLDGFYVGYDGSGNSLTVADGGEVSSVNNSALGAHVDSDENTALVTGTGSLWESLGRFFVGLNGSSNSLTIADGGQIYCLNDTALGSNEGSDNNTVIVTGTGSVWEVLDFFHVGWGGSSNLLMIADGGQVYSERGYIGNEHTADDNSVLVTGNGSVWSNDLLIVGNYGAGNLLTIADAGQVYSLNDSGLGNEVGSDGNEALVTGVGSFWEILDAFHVGWGGSSNLLTIADGGAVYSINDSSIGKDAGSDYNEVLVSGIGSIWEILDAFHVGSSGNWGNTLVIVSNAAVSATSVTIHNNNSVHLGSGGTLVSSGDFANANLYMYIGGASASDYGHLSVNGEADLNGSLEVILDGFVPFYGDVFDLFDWNGTLLNGFTAIDLPPLPPGLEWNTDALYTTGELSIDAQVIPADCIVIPPVNLKSRGRLPVAILSTYDFDATLIDPASVRFAGASPVKHTLTDQDRDGYLDLKLFFNARDLVINPDDPYVQLVAQDYSGQYMVGLPLIRIVPDK